MISSQVQTCKKRKREIPTAPAAARGYSAAELNQLAAEMGKRMLAVEHRVEEPLLSIANVKEIPLSRINRFRR